MLVAAQMNSPMMLTRPHTGANQTANHWEGSRSSSISINFLPPNWASIAR